MTYQTDERIRANNAQIRTDIAVKFYRLNARNRPLCILPNHRAVCAQNIFYRRVRVRLPTPADDVTLPAFAAVRRAAERKSIDISCSSGPRRQTGSSRVRRANGTHRQTDQGCRGAGTRPGGRRPPLFSTRGTRPPVPPTFLGLKFVQKLVHCCNWLLTETQSKIISVQQN